MDTAVMHLLTKRRDGRVSNVAQVGVQRQRYKQAGRACMLTWSTVAVAAILICRMTHGALIRVILLTYAVLMSCLAATYGCWDCSPLQFITSYSTEPAQPSSDTSTQQPPTPPSQPGLSQPQSQPLGVELEALLGSITEALSTDLADMANQVRRGR